MQRSPALQYGQHGAKWELQSWFVWGNGGAAVTAPAIDVSPGDELFSYMEYDEASEMSLADRIRAFKAARATSGA